MSTTDWPGQRNRRHPNGRACHVFASRAPRMPCYGRTMTRATARPLVAFLPFAMAACATADEYPSLAQRDFERNAGRVCGTATPVDPAPEPEPAPLPPASADLLARLEGLVSAAREADRRFASQRDDAERAVSRASGAAAASDPWAAAQVALAALETSRSAAIAALADLDTLYADARDAAPTEVSPSAEAIGRARSQVSELVAQENDVIAGLSARLRR